MTDKLALADQIERKAYREETLAALFFIAAGVAFSADMAIFGWLMTAKAVLDTFSAGGCWMRFHRVRAALRAGATDANG